MDSPAEEPADAADMPLTLAASVVLSALPVDAHEALERVDNMEGQKVAVRFVPLGSAPGLKQSVFKISATNRFETVITSLRKKLGVGAHESVICYVNNVFAPGLDEGVGGLWKCFRQGFEGKEQLVVSYSMTPAFG